MNFKHLSCHGCVCYRCVVIAAVSSFANSCSKVVEIALSRKIIHACTHKRRTEVRRETGAPRTKCLGGSRMLGFPERQSSQSRDQFLDLLFSNTTKRDKSERDRERGGRWGEGREIISLLQCGSKQVCSRWRWANHTHRSLVCFSLSVLLSILVQVWSKMHVVYQ